VADTSADFLAWMADALEADGEDPDGNLLVRLRKLAKSLTWKCETCSASFPDHPADPVHLEGVTRCSRCVIIENQATTIQTLRDST